jgi:hypothetical protein
VARSDEIRSIHCVRCTALPKGPPVSGHPAHTSGVSADRNRRTHTPTLRAPERHSPGSRCPIASQVHRSSDGYAARRRSACEGAIARRSPMLHPQRAARRPANSTHGAGRTKPDAAPDDGRGGLG